MYVHAVGRRGSVALRWDGGGELCGAQGRQPQLHGVREHDVSFELVVQPQPHPHLRHLRLGYTVPPTASVSAGPAFTSASSTVSALVSFSEPCPGRGGFVCNATYCNLIVYGSGSVDPSTLQVLSPGLRYSVAVAISPDAEYGRLVLVMGRGFCTDAAGHPFTRTPNSTFTLRFDRRSDSMNITATVAEKMVQIQGVTRLVQASNEEEGLRIYLAFAQPVLNSSEQILRALTATDAVAVHLTPTNRSTLGNRRFGYVKKMSDAAAIVSVACDTSSIISRQGTPVVPAEPFTFLYDTQRPWVKLGTSTRRTSSRDILVLIKFAKPVFNFSSSAVQVSGGNVLSFHEASKSIYTLQIQAVGQLVSVQVAENAAMDVAGNPNLASDRLQVRHYSVPASSSWIAAITTVVFLTTAAVAALLTVSTSSLVAAGAVSRPSSYMISEPSRNVLRMACHIQIFALSRWLSANLPIEYYEFAKGVEWSIPYMRLPWEGPAADPYLGYSTMPAIAYSESELLDRSAVGGAANISSYRPRAQQGQPVTPAQIIPSDPVFPTEIPEDGKPTPPVQTPGGDATPPVMPVQTPLPLDGMPLTAMEYRSFFENPDMKPEAQIIMKLQDLDGWKYFGRNMFWLGVIGGGLILLHLLTLLYFKLRYRDRERRRHGYAALLLPRLEIMVVVLAMPCVAQAAAALIRGGTTCGLVVGIVLTAVLTSVLVALLLFLSLGITMGKLLQYREVHHEEGQEEYHWYQDLARRTLGAGKRGQWTWKDPRRAACLPRLGPLFEDLRGPPKYTRGGGGGKRRAEGGGPERRVIASEDENEGSRAPLVQQLLGVLRIYLTLLESVKRVAVGIVAGAHASSGRSSRAHAVAVLSVASFQLLFMLLGKPFVKKRVQLVETLSVASEVAVFAACLALIDRTASSGGWLPDGEARGVGLAMLGAFVLGFAAQVCNEWNALYRQARLLSADRSSFLDGAKTAGLGLLVLVLPSSALGDHRDPPPPDGGGGAGESVSASTAADGGRGGSSNNERWWLGQLWEMAKASFSKESNA
uniref:Bacterial Ig-like domain-containing protein n=1 Tax=Zea mays TaxID=4577 RepID=A0A804QLM0_MAIZE